MTAKIVDIENLKRIGKFLSLTIADGLAREKVLKYHKLNVMNYNKVHETQYYGTKYKIEDIQLINVPLISSVQAVSDLETLLSNCLDYGLELNEQVYTEMMQQIQAFKEHYDYETMKQYNNHILF